jgi:hypothetical protein
MNEEIIDRSESRGHASHGWLDSHHTFSFAGYYNPERVHFGVLRVLNDDIVEGGKGFDTHPHENMEIISIPISGDLEHRDSIGNRGVIRQGDVQIMSAGTGVFHSEYNKNEGTPVNFLQIWIFPKEKDIAPRYDQKTFRKEDRTNRFQTVISPDKGDPETMWINQDAWLSLGTLKKGTKVSYALHKEGNGVYAFVIGGAVNVNNVALGKRDGCGIKDVSSLDIEAAEDAEVLLIEVPMALPKISSQ